MKGRGIQRREGCSGLGVDAEDSQAEFTPLLGLEEQGGLSVLEWSWGGVDEGVQAEGHVGARAHGPHSTGWGQ